MANNLDLIYLNYITPNTSYSSSSSASSAASSTSYSKNESTRNTKNYNRKNQTNQSNKSNQQNKELEENLSKLSNSNYNRMFQSNAYSKFKSEVREELRKVSEKQYEGLMRIKRLRQDKRYEEGIKMQYEKLKKMKTETEKSMYQIREYLDYIEVNKNSNNQFLPYLIGFESRYKMGDVIIPDIIGFTSKNRPEIRDQYMWFIFMMVKQFLGDLGYLYISIDKLLQYLPKAVDDLINSSDISMNLCKYYNDTPEMKALKNINNYYNLLSDILDNGKFNINKFFSDPSTKKDEKTKKGGGDLQNLIKFASASSKLGKNKKKSSFNDNKKGDDYDKKVKYILKNESLSLKDPKVGSTSNFDTLKKLLREDGKKIFIGKLNKDLESLPITFPTHSGSKIKDNSDIREELTYKPSNNLDKQDKEFLNNVLEQIKNLNPKGKFTEIVELCDRGSTLTLRDFYTGKEITTKDTLSSDEQNYKYYNGVRKLYKLYEKFYDRYGIKDLPLASDSKTEQKKIGLNILKGIGNYCSIVREFLIESIRRVESNDILIREKERVERLKKEKEERNLREKQERNQREKQQKNQKEKEEVKPVNKNALMKKKIERINKEIAETKSNVVKKRLQELKLKVLEGKQ